MKTTKTVKKAGTVRPVRRPGAAIVERLVPVRDPANKLTEAEMVAAFRVEDSNPLWLAVNQILAEHLNDARSQTSHPDTAANHGMLAHCAGGMEWLGFLQAELAGRKAASEAETLLDKD
ncbi:MAG: hypothetical protein ACOYM3_27370, partial [Terrimicrobiaceae bacterium]